MHDLNDRTDDEFIENLTERNEMRGELALDVLLEITRSDLYTTEQLTHIGHTLINAMGLASPDKAHTN